MIINNIKDRIVNLGHMMDDLDLSSERIEGEELDTLLESLDDIRQEMITLATEVGDLDGYLISREAEVEKLKREEDTRKGLAEDKLKGYINSEIASLTVEYKKALEEKKDKQACYLYGCITTLQRLVKGIESDLFINDGGFLQ